MLGDSRRQLSCWRCSLASSFWLASWLARRESSSRALSQGLPHVLVAHVRRAVMHRRVRACALQRAIPKLSLERQPRTPVCMEASMRAAKDCTCVVKYAISASFRAVASLCAQAASSARAACDAAACAVACTAAALAACSTTCAAPRLQHAEVAACILHAGAPQVAEQGLPGSLRTAASASDEQPRLHLPSTRGETGSTQSLQPALFSSMQRFQPKLLLVGHRRLRAVAGRVRVDACLEHTHLVLVVCCTGPPHVSSSAPSHVPSTMREGLLPTSRSSTRTQ